MSPVGADGVLESRAKAVEKRCASIARVPNDRTPQESFDSLDAAALQARLAHAPVAFHIELLEQCESTNTVLLGRAAAGAKHATLIGCEAQTRGRGRRGATWVTLPGGSLAFSLLWRFASDASTLSGLSLAVGVAVARALEALGARDISLKWPNDILAGSAKLGGILIELAGDDRRSSAAVIGIGLNVAMPPEARAGIGIPVADLRGAGVTATRNQILAAVMEELADTLIVFSREGFAPFRDDWLGRHAWQGQAVSLRVAERPVAEGIAMGIGDDGALLLQCDGRVERFHAGELSLRRA
jgi:BirA family biotin operon repressor/biotin-[acetyl-CoA-carboxylase] ligase